MAVVDIVIDQPHDHMEVGGRTMPGAIVESLKKQQFLCVLCGFIFRSRNHFFLKN